MYFPCRNKSGPGFGILFFSPFLLSEMRNKYKAYCISLFDGSYPTIYGSAWWW
jgi:hypothetical protein